MALNLVGWNVVLDFHVKDVEEAVKYALSCGAIMSEVQCEDGWRVMIDPAGHPFLSFATTALGERELRWEGGFYFGKIYCPFTWYKY